jgi:hypothetical protein
MKRITNKSLQTALLRGAVVVSGCIATAITSLFFDSIYGVVVTLCLGAGMIALIDDQITTNLNKK